MPLRPDEIAEVQEIVRVAIEAALKPVEVIIIPEPIPEPAPEIVEAEVPVKKGKK